MEAESPDNHEDQVQQDVENKEEMKEEAKVSLEESSSDEDDYKVVRVPPNTSFRFYDYPFNVSAIEDILQSIKTLRKSYAQEDLARESSELTLGPLSSFASHQPQTLTKTFDIKEYQRTMFDPRASLNKSKTNTIARFRPDKPKWDSTAFPSPDLMNELYRMPISDPTGKVITTLGRDLAKGVKPWRPPENGRDLPEPTAVNCSPRRKKNLLAHMNAVIEKVGEEYKHMKADTNKKRTIKAQLGADLNSLKQERDRLIRDFQMDHSDQYMEAESKSRK